eukprot:jgi/Mesen1/7092/ME000369S06419
MRSLHRQMQHGPTCRSMVIMVIGLCIICVQLRPNVPQLSHGSVADDLRQMMPRIKGQPHLWSKEGRVLAGKRKQEKEEALVEQAQRELGLDTGTTSVAQAHAAAEELATKQADAELSKKVADSEVGRRELEAQTSGKGIHVMLTSNGWVREMYAFSIATALAKMPIDLPPVPLAIMSQPPADSVVGEAAILHYTWGSEIKDNAGKLIWEFDKRKFTSRGLPDRFPDIPDSASEAQLALMTRINGAITSLPKYTAGELAEEGHSPEEVKRLMQEQQQKVQEAQKREGGQLLATTRVGGGAEVTKGSIHVMATSNGSPYMNWQTRIMYHTYLKVASQPQSDMRYFTRVLHRMTDDALSADIHTLRVDPLDPRCDVWCEYPVASRPDAINKWLNSGDVKGDWVFMIETDYLFTKPVSTPASGRALGFPFGYIIPTYPTIHDIMTRYYPGDLRDVPQTGNAPVLATTADLKWVREMYAFSIAAALAKMPIDLPPVPQSIMVQPPADSQLGEAAIIHYTWGSEIKNDKGEVIWSWDKRTWTTEGSFPPHIPDPPPGLASELQLIMVSILNDAIDAVNPSQ